MKIRCAIYTRVSLEEQTKNYSLSSQREALEKYASENDLEIFNFYTDDGYSAKDYNRPAFQQMIKELKKDKFDVILCWHIDRLSRNTKDILILIDDVLKPLDKRVIVTQLNMDSSKTSDYMGFVLYGMLATHERQRIIDRVNMGMEQRVKEGKWNGGRMLGYDNVNKLLVINKEESKIVKKIFELRAEGKGYKLIADYLNSRGYKTKNKNSFSINGVKTILSNEKYTGVMTWGKFRSWNEIRRMGKREPEKYTGLHETIIPIELWEAVQRVNKVQKEKFNYNRNYKGEFLLSGLVRCSKCGSGAVMHKSKGIHYYMCQSYHTKGKNVCSANLVRKDWIEKKVESIIFNLVNNPTIISNVIDDLEKSQSIDTKQLEKDTKTLRSAIESQKKKLEKLDKDFLNNYLETNNEFHLEQYNRLSLQINGEIERLQGKLQIIISEIEERNDLKMDREFIINCFKNFGEVYHTSETMDKKSLLKALVKRVEVTDDRKDIKDIEFWFLPKNFLPMSEMRRTVPQVNEIWIG